MPRTRVLALIALLVLLASSAGTAKAASCPGAGECPYLGVTQIGSRAEGTLRFPQAVAVGPDGAIYVGDQYSHVVQVFDTLGVWRREIGQSGTAPGQLGSVGGVAVGPDNSIYVADSANRINRFARDGRLLDHWGSTGSELGQFRLGAGGGNASGAGGGVVVGPDGLVYVADTRNDRVQRFAADGSSPRVIVAPGQVRRPQGLAVRGTRIIVADDLNHRLAVFDTGGRPLASVGNGLGVGPGQLQNPYDVAVDAKGRVFVADDLNHRVVYFGPAPGYRYRGRWGTFGTGPGQLAYPRGLGADVAGRTYVADPGNNRVDVFSLSGRGLRSFGVSGRSRGQFIDPQGVAVDASGLRAIADTVNGRIQLVGPDGGVQAIFGAPNPGPTVLSQPAAVAFDTAGGVYVVDQRRSRVTVFDRAGTVMRTFGASGSGPGKLDNPTAIAVDDAGTIYVADSGNKRIARFAPDGSWAGQVGRFSLIRGVAVSADGTRIYASDGNLDRITVWDPAGEQLARFGRRGSGPGQLNAPAQIAVDGAGTVWVADRLNDRIQAFDASGTPVASFGGRGTGAGQFIRPTGVSVGCDGRLIVGDSDNNRVQSFALTTSGPSSCRALPAVVDPPHPDAPTLPPEFPSQLTAIPERRTALLRRRGLALRARCDRPCTLTINGTVRPSVRPAGGRKAVRVAFINRTATLPAGKLRTIHVALPASAVRRLRDALRDRRTVTVTLTLVAISPGSPSTTAIRTFNANG